MASLCTTGLVSITGLLEFVDVRFQVRVGTDALALGCGRVAIVLPRSVLNVRLSVGHSGILIIAVPVFGVRST